MPAVITTKVIPKRENQDDRVRAEDVLPVLDAEEHVLRKRQVDAEDEEAGEDAGVSAERRAAAFRVDASTEPGATTEPLMPPPPCDR